MSLIRSTLPNPTSSLSAAASEPPLLVLCHLRWAFVFQRPQHLMSEASKERPVYYTEEPIFGDHADHLSCREVAPNLHVCVPMIEAGHSPEESQRRTAALLSELAGDWPVYDLWVYTPMELPVTAGLSPRLTVYDCMDELANFKGASPILREREQQLFAQADVVFTGGQRLYEAKRQQHPNVHAFPSSVDLKHFAQARQPLPEPEDQAAVPHPRLGYYGVIDERLDLELLGTLAQRRPEWHFVLVGPTVKIDPATLPQAPNLHYLGIKDYAQLPSYLASWDVALMPFALNAATEFISPTKTPEYLAGGVAVVSTGIHDVIRPYGERQLVRIANGPEAFEQACCEALAEARTEAAERRTEAADAYLAGLSWQRTWQEMSQQLARLTGPLAGAAYPVNQPPLEHFSVDQLQLSSAARPAAVAAQALAGAEQVSHQRPVAAQQGRK